MRPLRPLLYLTPTILLAVLLIAGHRSRCPARDRLRGRCVLERRYVHDLHQNGHGGRWTA